VVGADKPRRRAFTRMGTPYDLHLDRFWPTCRLTVFRSQHSQRSYAYDLLVWVRFLEEVPQQVRLAGYARRTWMPIIAPGARPTPRTASPPPPGTALWLRSISCTEGPSRLALSLQSPFTYRDVWRPATRPGRGSHDHRTRNQAYERAAKRSDVKFVHHRGLPAVSVDVGLQGLAVRWRRASRRS